MLRYRNPNEQDTIMNSGALRSMAAEGTTPAQPWGLLGDRKGVSRLWWGSWEELTYNGTYP